MKILIGGTPPKKNGQKRGGGDSYNALKQDPSWHDVSVKLVVEVYSYNSGHLTNENYAMLISNYIDQKFLLLQLIAHS